MNKKKCIFLVPEKEKEVRAQKAIYELLNWEESQSIYKGGTTKIKLENEAIVATFEIR